jgi:hypothetical protein
VLFVTDKEGDGINVGGARVVEPDGFVDGVVENVGINDSPTLLDETTNLGLIALCPRDLRCDDTIDDD